jgi:hypothetical protein
VLGLASQGAMCSHSNAPRRQAPGPTQVSCANSSCVLSHVLSQNKTYETDTAALARGLCRAAEAVRRRSMCRPETPPGREWKTHPTCDDENHVAGQQRREWAPSQPTERVPGRPFRTFGSVPRRKKAIWSEVNRTRTGGSGNEALGQTHARGSSEPVLEDFFKVGLVTDRQTVGVHGRA